MEQLNSNELDFLFKVIETMVTPAEEVNQWIDEIRKEYETAWQHLEDCKQLPKTNEVEEIVGKAKEMKAERSLVLASMRSDVAEWINDLMEKNTEGKIYIDLPECGLKALLQW